MVNQIGVVFLFMAFAVNFQVSEGRFFEELPEMLDAGQIPSNLQAVGCFQLPRNKSAPFKAFFSGRYSDKQLRKKNPVSRCSDQATLENIILFGVKAFPIEEKTKVVCLREVTKRQHLLQDSVDCQDGVGGATSVYVYEFVETPSPPGGSSQCEYNGKTFNEGDIMKMLDQYDPIKPEANCVECTCKSGKPTQNCPVVQYCEGEIKGLQYCEKISVASGDCCPSCECVNKGKVVEKGEEWKVKKLIEKGSDFKRYSEWTFRCLGNNKAEAKESNEVIEFS